MVGRLPDAARAGRSGFAREGDVIALVGDPAGSLRGSELAKLRGQGQTLCFGCTDTDVDWAVTLGPDGYTWRRGNGEADVSVRGAAADLLLLAYGRRRPDDPRFERSGDEQVLRHWLAHSAL